MADQFIYRGTFSVIHCANCGVPFGITPEYEQRRRDDHKGFNCPNGHSNVYNGLNAEEKLRQERDKLKQNGAYLENQIRAREAEIQRQRERANAAHRQTRAFKGVVTRTKNRVGAGVCPCCNRSFASLARHMQHKHPEYRKEKAVANG